MRRGCHLCEEMVAAITAFDAAIALDLIDIDGDAELVERFGSLIPVLADGKQLICHWNLNRAALAGHLARTAS